MSGHRRNIISWEDSFLSAKPGPEYAALYDFKVSLSVKATLYQIHSYSSAAVNMAVAANKMIENGNIATPAKKENNLSAQHSRYCVEMQAKVLNSIE